MNVNIGEGKCDAFDLNIFQYYCMKSHKSLFFWDFGVLAMKGSISENAQGISPGTLLYFEEVATRNSINVVRRNKVHPKNQALAPQQFVLN